MCVCKTTNNKTMRIIDKIIVHCTAGSQKNTAKDVIAYHTKAKSLGGCGWKVAGYHYIVEANGNVVNAVPEEQVSNGCYGQNQHAINVAYIGGVDMSKAVLKPIDNRTNDQKAALVSLLRYLKVKYPQAKIYGHRDFSKKACPSFDAKKEYADL